ncbi:hypothetical protein [Niastella populi]|uniref:Uncharacterized protein n=1 Tax=Niastella populi TaxID=550983 RepID=A0A1V9GAZ7_9BACT|nr:hypothetical protein [Niastella populi]OQP67638.1 hypothetical protein A4R26_33090 [Niastella populi]
MSIVTRKFSACPVRTAADTWETIVSVISSVSAEARSELLKIEGIAASIISDETPRKSPITIIGTGSRLRVYCLYEENGSAEEVNESPLNWNPFAGEWEIHIPAEKDELDWVTQALSEKGARFKAYEAGTKPVEDEGEKTSSQQTKHLTIDISKL